MSTIRKALVAAGGAAATALVAALGAGLSDGRLTGPEVLIAIGAGLTAAAAVGRVTWQVPNGDAPVG